MSDDTVVIVIPREGSAQLVSWTGRIYTVAATPNGGLRIEPLRKKEPRKKQS